MKTVFDKVDRSVPPYPDHPEIQYKSEEQAARDRRFIILSGLIVALVIIVSVAALIAKARP